MTIETKCKFCGVEVQAEADDACTKEWVDVLAPMICCNRCGDYRQWKRRLVDRLKTICRDWSMKKDKDGAREGIRLELERITRKMVDVMAKFHRSMATWDAELVSFLMEHPDLCEYIVNNFERTIAR